MKRVFLLCTAVIMALSLSACTRNESGKSSSRPVGAAIEKSPAPDLTVTDLKGAPVSLSSLKGTVVLLNFWATWCPPCREEIPSMIKLAGAMAGKPFRMLAVSIDEGGVGAVEAYLKESGSAALPVYMDKENSAARTYGITGVPETFIIDKSGILVKKVIGPMDWNSPEAVSFLEGLMK